MKKRNIGLFLLITIIFILSFSALTFANTSTTINRLAGIDRYETASQVAKAGCTQSDYVILAYGENYPDALSSAPLAKKYNAPILLTLSNSLPNTTKQTLIDLQVKNVIVIGGTGVISPSIDAELRSMGISSNRLAGQDRYETSLIVASQFSDISQIAVTTGEDFADALSIASIASNKNMPIILVPKNDISDNAREFIKQHNLSKTFIVGNTDQISDNVAIQFPNVERITGATKYERNIAVLNKFSSDLSGNNVYVATGNDFADALAGTALAAKNNSPIVLVDNNINTSTKNYLTKNLSYKQLSVLGGTAVVSESLIQEYTNTATTTLSPSEISKLVSPSVVYIEVSDSSGKVYASGSGFFINNNGKIVTNYHVIKGASSAKVVLTDGRAFDMNKVYAYDSNRDIAVLGINATGFATVNLGDSNLIGTGDKIYTIGSPEGYENTFSDGLISNKARTFDGQKFIQISAPISHGSSGGVLINENAEVIGITTSGVMEGENIGFAIPINDVKGSLSMNIGKTLADLNGGILPSPVTQNPTPTPTPSNPSNTNKMTDSEFENYLNNNYGVLTINRKSMHFTWNVNDYKTGSSDVSVHGMIHPDDFGNWLDGLLNNKQSEITASFNRLNADIMTNYPDKTFWGSIMYQDYYPFYPYSFKSSEISLGPNLKWLVTHSIVSFYDFRMGGKSYPSIVIN